MDYFDVTTNREVRNRLSNYKRSFIICPEQWNTIVDRYSTLEWSEIKFCEENRDILNEVEGLYLILASPKKANATFINYFFYVGETDNLRRRFGQYLDKKDNPKSGQYKVYTIIEDFPENLYFYYIELPSYDQIRRREIENEFLTAFTPPINSKYPQGLQSLIQAVYGQ